MLQKLQLFYIKNKFLDYLSYFGGGRGVVSLREAELMVFHFPSFSQIPHEKCKGFTVFPSEMLNSGRFTFIILGPKNPRRMTFSLFCLQGQADGQDTRYIGQGQGHGQGQDT